MKIIPDINSIFSFLPLFVDSTLLIPPPLYSKLSLYSSSYDERSLFLHIFPQKGGLKFSY